MRSVLAVFLLSCPCLDAWAGGNLHARVLSQAEFAAQAPAALAVGVIPGPLGSALRLVPAARIKAATWSLAAGSAAMRRGLAEENPGGADLAAERMYSGRALRMQAPAAPVSAIGRGSAMLLIPKIELKPVPAELEEPLKAAMDHLEYLALDDRSPLSDEDKEPVFLVASRLADMMSSGLPGFGVFPAVVRFSEDFLLGFAAPEKIALAREVLKSLRGRSEVLAQYLFNQGHGSLHPKMGTVERIELQRRIFGETYSLRAVLRGVIDLKKEDDSELGQRAGKSVRTDNYTPEFEEAFKSYGIDPDYAAIAAHALARLRPGSLYRIEAWGVLQHDDIKLLYETDYRRIGRDVRLRIAERIRILIRNYETRRFTKPQIEAALERLVPARVLDQMLRDTGLSRAHVPSLLKHSDFDTWIYNSHSTVLELKAKGFDQRLAWKIVLNHGPKTSGWMERARPVVERLGKIVPGEDLSWEIANQEGLRDAMAWAESRKQELGERRGSRNAWRGVLHGEQ
ncbi:MAG: hypothetical protein HY921_04150 [Elusimicrobia bacterium]|nr:hypothetical protein [Elusimicrobiota bacterium]